MSIQMISPNRREQETSELFLSAYGRNMANAYRSALRNLFKEYRELYPDRSVLDRTHDTFWISPWDEAHPAMSKATRMERLYALMNLMRFRYEHGMINANIYELLNVPSSEKHHGLCLPSTDFAIHREIENWAASIPGLAQRGQKPRRPVMLRFAAGSHAYPGPWPSLPAIRGWLVSVRSSLQLSCLVQYVRWIELFLEHLNEKGLIEHNPFADLRRAYPARGLRGIVGALCEKDAQTALLRLEKETGFKSYLAKSFEDYLRVKRAAGRVYDHDETILRRLDRFLFDGGYLLDRESFQSWITSHTHLHRATHSHYYHQARTFCEYLRRLNPGAFVPDLSLDPLPKRPRIPIVLSATEVAAVIKAAGALNENDRWPLRRLTFKVIVTLLYCCGMRVGEVARLDVGDVDLQDGVLCVRITKFFKTRLVPMSEPVSAMVAEYLAERKGKGIPDAPDSPLFYSSRGRRYFKGTIKQVVKRLMESAGVRKEDRRVRIHDLRHTFAVHRLIQWYENGENVQAKLPILTQYLGHVDMTNTRKYLTMIPELSQAAMNRYHAYAVRLGRVDHEKQ